MTESSRQDFLIDDTWSGSSIDPAKLYYSAVLRWRGGDQGTLLRGGSLTESKQTVALEAAAALTKVTAPYVWIPSFQIPFPALGSAAFGIAAVAWLASQDDPSRRRWV